MIQFQEEKKQTNRWNDGQTLPATAGCPIREQNVTGKGRKGITAVIFKSTDLM